MGFSASSGATYGINGHNGSYTTVWVSLQMTLYQEVRDSSPGSVNEMQYLGGVFSIRHLNSWSFIFWFFDFSIQIAHLEAFISI